MTPIALCCTQQSRDKGHRSNGSAVRAQTNGQMDIQTDRCYQVHYLPFFAVDKCMSEWVFLTFRLIWSLSYTTLHYMQLLITAGDIPISSVVNGKMAQNFRVFEQGAWSNSFIKKNLKFFPGIFPLTTLLL